MHIALEDIDEDFTDKERAELTMWMRYEESQGREHQKESIISLAFVTHRSYLMYRPMRYVLDENGCAVPDESTPGELKKRPDDNWQPSEFFPQCIFDRMTESYQSRYNQRMEAIGGKKLKPSKKKK